MDQKDSIEKKMGAYHDFVSRFFKNPANKGKTLKHVSEEWKKTNPPKAFNTSHKLAGWKAASPKKGPQRRAMLGKCGPSCFLDPANLKYPICDANCSVDPRGILAAKHRAAQFGHPDLVSKANSAGAKLGMCKNGKCSLKYIT
jgi:hypothetical protein